MTADTAVFMFAPSMVLLLLLAFSFSVALAAQPIIPQQVRDDFSRRAWRAVVSRLLPVYPALEKKPANPEFGDALYMLGRCWYSLNEPDSMFLIAAAWTSPSKIRESAYNGTRAALVTGMAYYRKEHYKDAVRWLMRADSIEKRKPTLQPTVAGALYNYMALALEELGRNTEALSSYQNGLARLTGTSMDERRIRSALNNNIGTLYRAEGDFDSALHHLRSDLEDVLELYGDQSRDAAYSYLNIGNVYLDMGDERTAIAYFDKAERIASVLEPSPGSFSSLVFNAIGNARQGLGEYKAAEAWFLKSLEARIRVYGPKHPQVAVAQNNLSGVYLSLGNYPKAIEMARQSLAIRSAALEAGDPRLFASRFGLAKAFLGAGRLDSSDTHTQLLLTMARGPLQQNSRFLAEALTLQGKIAEKKGQLALAEAHYENALLHLRYTSGGNVLWKTPVNALQTYQRMLGLKAKRLPAAQMLPYADTLLAIFYQAQDAAEHLRTRQNLTAVYREACGALVPSFVAVWQRSANPAMLEKALTLSGAARSATLQRLVRENHARQFAGIPESELSRERSLVARIQKTEAQLALEASPDQALSDSLIHWRDKHSRMLRHFQKAYPRYYELQHSRPEIVLEALQNQLPANTLQLELFTAGGQTALFALSNRSANAFMLGPDSIINPSIARFQQAVLSNNSGGITKEGQFLSRLFTSLIPELLSYSLIMVPDGAWVNFPFDALKDESGHFWAERTILTSAAPDGRRNTRSRSSTKTYAGIAPVYFTSSDLREPLQAFRSGLTPLPFSAREVMLAKQQFDAKMPFYYRVLGSLNKAYVKSSETETAVIQSLAENNVVHLATHTLIDPEMPGRSRLIFRQDAQHDGLLQQQELFGLTIHSELIFLNSCGSALGQIIPGDGVWGFIAALRYAGADAIVATLWPVADQPSAFLSSGFFSHYANGLPATEALSLAKRAMIQQPEKFRVRDWAGYTLFQ